MESPRLGPFPLYNPDFEHDACGTGFIAQVDGEATHRVVELGLRALSRMTHRGAVSADRVSGDGAGIAIQIPRSLLADDAEALGMPQGAVDRLAVGMIFLPADEVERARVRQLCEGAVVDHGLQLLGWRVVPVEASVLGAAALVSAPVIEQLLILRPTDVEPTDFESSLYSVRRSAEAVLREEGLDDAYVVSLSSRTVVYKGLLDAPDLARYFTDLRDPRTRSALVTFHQRFATNTLPVWRQAQPFRRVAHNGEVNTLRGNRNWMAAREADLKASRWGSQVDALTPIITPGGSDTAALDEALDLLVASGRDLLESMAILIPEAWENDEALDPDLRAFYQVHASLMEPWDGPAAVVLTDGRVAAVATDRNGLRPARYQRTSDGLVIVSSEVGVLDLDPDQVIESGRLGPGQMIAVDTALGLVLHDREIKAVIAGRLPWKEWIEENLREVDGASAAQGSSGVDSLDLSQQHVLHGYTKEELRVVLGPMAAEGKEPTGSMGDDTPLSVLSDGQRTLASYFRQRFAQVTNPPIDPIRERLVMSLDTYLGARGNLLEPGPEAARLLRLRSPILTDATIAAVRDEARSGLVTTTLDATFAADGGADAMAATIDDISAQAVAAIRAGVDTLILSDRSVDGDRAPIPMLLAVSALHQHLIGAGLRSHASLIAETGDARDVHHFAALIGFGASAVHPYLAFATVRAGATDADDGGAAAVDTYVAAVERGLRRVMSKMGVATVSAYHGAQLFEAVGLGSAVVARYFPGTTSRIEGIGLDHIAHDCLSRHTAAFAAAELESGGWYGFRRGGEYHANGPTVWRALHDTVKDAARDEYRRYADLVHGRPVTALRDLLDFSPDRDPIDLEDVEPASDIVRRFQTGAMSLGALSPEAHEDIALAMNRIGALSNSGEGGEDPERYSPWGSRTAASSQIKQVASARFGVTTGYLATAVELEIKMAQGSKPGEGGQLPGEKVSSYIAQLRHVEPGTQLISPPPHHDIYSIEDLAQLIHDLKTVNPTARIAVKLVSAEGVGTIAAGVAKAHADVIHISGADGGTGASPLSSVKYAGDPWELGVAEAQQTLVRNGLRDRVVLTTDGGMHTGRDVVKAALLGAERYGFGTAALIALGCKMARQCHNNTCPVGIATQAEELRARYFGTPEMLVSFLMHVAGEVREILAGLGYSRLDDVVGRSDLLRQIEAAGDERWRGVDLSSMIEPARTAGAPPSSDATAAEPTLDETILHDLGDALTSGRGYTGDYAIHNTDRTVGACVSGRIARVHGDRGLPGSTINLTFRGSAGASFGAWLLDGVRMELIGEANDHVAKGMTGGEIAIRHPIRPGSQALDLAAWVMAGDSVLYGATGGSLFIAGSVGERFAVRNSGASAVVEGVGQHGCEYMTGGVVVVLGPTGRNFAAGMSGGTAFVFDESGDFAASLNGESVARARVTSDDDATVLRALVQRHLERTRSKRALDLLSDWDRALPLFWKVAPGATGNLRDRRMVSSRAARVRRDVESVTLEVSP